MKMKKILSAILAIAMLAGFTTATFTASASTSDTIVEYSTVSHRDGETCKLDIYIEGGKLQIGGMGIEFPEGVDVSGATLEYKVGGIEDFPTMIKDAPKNVVMLGWNVDLSTLVVDATTKVHFATLTFNSSEENVFDSLKMYKHETDVSSEYDSTEEKWINFKMVDELWANPRIYAVYIGNTNGDNVDDFEDNIDAPILVDSFVAAPIIKDNKTPAITPITSNTNTNTSFAVPAFAMPMFFHSLVVNFDTDGGSAVKSQSVMANGYIKKLPVPVKEGCTFDGWYVNKAYVKRFTPLSRVTSNMTVYAKWVKA